MGRKNGMEAAMMVTAVSEADQMSRSAEVSRRTLKLAVGPNEDGEKKKTSYR